MITRAVLHFFTVVITAVLDSFPTFTLPSIFSTECSSGVTTMCSIAREAGTAIAPFNAWLPFDDIATYAGYVLDALLVSFVIRVIRIAFGMVRGSGTGDAAGA
jgi:hypothetical protein